MQNKGAAPRTAKKLDSKALLLLALFCGPLCGLLCPVSVVLFSSFVVPVCVSARVAGWFLLCGSFLPFVSRAPTQETEHFRRQPPSTYAVMEYAATYIGGNPGLPIVLCTVQFFSAFSPSPILASAYCAFHRPSRERKRYYSLWSSVFPVPSGTSRHHVYSRLSPNARRHNSSRQPHHIVYLAMAVAATVHDRRCIFRHADTLVLSSS